MKLTSAVIALICVQVVLSASVTNADYDNANTVVPAFKAANPVQSVAVFTAQWCPDCQGGKPNIDACIQAALKNGFNVLYGDVGTKTQFRSPGNPFVTDPLYQVHAVPTLLLIKNNQITASVIDNQIFDQSQVQAFINALSGKTEEKEDVSVTI